jgi:hypothetical protein
MNKKLTTKLALCVTVLVVLIALTVIVWREKHKQFGVLAIPQFNSREEQVETEHKALLGSPEAADTIVGIYCLYPNSDALYWASIAAENNSRNGAFSMANFLSESYRGVEAYSDYQREREYFWLQKAIKGDNPHDAINMSKIDFPNATKLQSEPETAIQKWSLTEKMLPRFKRAAMRGSPEAAYKLYEYFRESNEGLFWAIIAAQNGHRGAPPIIVEPLGSGLTFRYLLLNCRHGS